MSKWIKHIAAGLIATAAAAQTAGAAQANTCPARAPVELVLGVQNVKMLAWPVSLKIGENGYRERIKAFRAFAANRDIVGLTEVFERSAWNDSNWHPFKRELDKHFKHYARTTHNNGLVIASKFPILKTDELWFSKHEFFSGETFVQKGAVHALINHPEAGVLSVIVTHLQSGESGVSVSVRAAQLRQLREFVDKVSADNDSDGVIVMGDFNVERQIATADAEYETFEDAFGFSAGTFRDHGTDTYTWRLDYILTGKMPAARFKNGVGVKMLTWDADRDRLGYRAMNKRDKDHEVSDHPAIYGTLCAPTGRPFRAVPQAGFPPFKIIRDAG